MNTLCKPKFIITCKTQDMKKTKKKKVLPKYTTHKDLKLEMNKVNPLKKFLTKFFGEEIDYKKFNKESKWAIRIDEDDTDGKTKKMVKSIFIVVTETHDNKKCSI